MSGRESWFAAQGIREGLPVMIRARQPQVARPLREMFPDMLCVEFLYDVVDDSGLPSEQDYQAIARLEETAFDPIDFDLGVLLYVNTWNGRVRYYFYAADIDEAVAAIDEKVDETIRLEFSFETDPEWTIYADALKAAGVTPPGA